MEGRAVETTAPSRALKNADMERDMKTAQKRHPWPADCLSAGGLMSCPSCTVPLGLWSSWSSWSLWPSGDTNSRWLLLLMMTRMLLAWRLVELCRLLDGAGRGEIEVSSSAVGRTVQRRGLRKHGVNEQNESRGGRDEAGN